MKVTALLFVASAQALRLNKWTAMDSAIRDAESQIILGANAEQEKREKGELTTLSGFNTNYDEHVTRMHEPGDPAMDDDYLHGVFHRHYTRYYGDEKERKKHPNAVGLKVLTKDNALLASKEVVMQWNHMNEAEAEKYLNKNFEKAWNYYDVNNDGHIRVSEAYNFEKSLIGSFSVTYSDE